MVDTKLENGDFAVDGRGLPFFIDEIEEILQRAYIRLKVPKGSFVLDKELGSTLYKLKELSDKDLHTAALIAVREALLPVEGIVVEDVVVERVDGGGLYVAVDVRCGGKSERVELSV